MNTHKRLFLNFSFLLELILFAFTLFLAVGIALNLLAKTLVGPKLTLERGLSAWQFVLIFIIATAILLLLLKYFKKPWIIKGLFYLAIIEGLWVFSQAYFDWPYFLYVLIFLLIFWYIYRNVLVHNVVIILAIAAISVIFGLNLNPGTAVIILLLLAVYDYWAVYKTKHMIKMFQGMVEAKVHFALIIPFNFKGLFKKIKEVSPETEFMFLGTGDLALPAIFVVTVLKTSLMASFISALGAILGFIVLYFLFVTQKQKKPMPGLPPIVLGTLVGYLISFLI